ncbi:hypothetical protein HAX54_017526 [Datura stramonium]|uniref:Uncharacterized protein n=1 Tax=Datura stramonium TaxID=4076 RepID=A0ABS8UNS5_DATST|nr:hypothetical protein [Datura stramonium]
MLSEIQVPLCDLCMATYANGNPQKDSSSCRLTIGPDQPLRVRSPEQYQCISIHIVSCNSVASTILFLQMDLILALPNCIFFQPIPDSPRKDLNTGICAIHGPFCFSSRRTQRQTAGGERAWGACRKQWGFGRDQRHERLRWVERI